ncbi:UNVERIFIED_CONTAM: hypothetical protein FKN15_013936 [Acipenser sinensis]
MDLFDCLAKETRINTVSDMSVCIKVSKLTRDSLAPPLWSWGVMLVSISSSVVVGSHARLNVTVMLQNRGDSSYNTTLLFLYPDGLSFAKMVLLQENDMKRLRAMKKAAQERELTNQKESDLAALQQEMTSLNREREALEKRVLRHAVFLRYLERVVQASEQFQEVRQVMSRYDTLVLTREDLLRTAQENQENMDRARTQLARFLEEKNDVVLQYNNQLAHLQSRLDRARSDALLWDTPKQLEKVRGT